MPSISGSSQNRTVPLGPLNERFPQSPVYLLSIIPASPMSVPRLTFLYPHLFHSIKKPESVISRHTVRVHRQVGCTAVFSSTSKSKQEAYAQRYGPANQPHPPPQLPPSSPQSTTEKEEPKSLSTAIEKEVKAAPPQKQDEKKAPTAPKEPDEPPTEASSGGSNPQTESAAATMQEASIKLDAAESHPKEDASVPNQEIAEAKPLERLLQMNSPDDEHKPPHLHAPPYVHHFDTFTLVRDLEKGGFTQAQSVTLMKAVRSLLALNLDVAREGLVSKSDVENVCFS